MEKARDRNQSLYFCFVDYEKAFDTVPHDQLQSKSCLKSDGFSTAPRQTAAAAESVHRPTTSGCHAVLRTAHLMSAWFRVKNKSGQNA
jgi:hypothetical protein